MKAGIPVVVLLLASVLWGASWWPLKTLEGQGVAGVALIAVSYGVMLLATVPWLWRQKRWLRQAPSALLGILLVGGAANLCFNSALIYGEVVRVMVLFYLLPVWGVLGGKFLLGEVTDGWRWMGVALAVGGAFILLGGPQIFSQPPGWIDLVAIASGLFFALNNIIFRAAADIPVMTKLAALFLGCCLLSGLLLGAGVGRLEADVPVAVWGWVVVYALFWLFWANFGSQWAVTQMAAGRSSILIIMELVAAVVTALWIGGEVLTTEVVVGGALILSATLIEVMRGPINDPEYHRQSEPVPAIEGDRSV